jgi:hypothetical protein
VGVLRVVVPRATPDVTVTGGSCKVLVVVAKALIVLVLVGSSTVTMVLTIVSAVIM